MAIKFKPRKGFTLVELVIAVTIVGMVSALSLPVYTRVSEQFELENEVGLIADCIRGASDLARSQPEGFGKRITEGTSVTAANDPLSSGRLRYAAAVIVQSGSGITCQQSWITGSVPLSSIQTASVPASETGLVSTLVQRPRVALTATVTNASSLSLVRNEIYFDAAKGGQVVLIRTCTSADGSTGCSWFTDIGAGLPYSATIVRGRAQSQLTVSAYGSPITVRGI